MCDDRCQKCSSAPIEYDSPAPLCAGCWTNWWTADGAAEEEWDQFFLQTGREHMCSWVETERVDEIVSSMEEQKRKYLRSLLEAD